MFSAMWPEKLGTIKANRHRTELKTGVWPVYQQTKRAGTKVNYIER